MGRLREIDPRRRVSTIKDWLPIPGCIIADRPPRLLLEIEVGQLLPRTVDHDKGGVQIFDGPGRWVIVAAKLRTKDEARRIADDVAKLPETCSASRKRERRARLSYVPSAGVAFQAAYFSVSSLPNTQGTLLAADIKALR